MKTAIILTGAMRSFDKCLPNLQWHVFRHFPGAQFYVATEMDEDCKKAALLAEKYGRENVLTWAVTQPEMVIPPGCPSEWTPGRPYMHEPYHISVDPRAVLGQLWMLREGWRFYQGANDPADLVIRCRPDLWFHSFEMPTPVWEAQRNDYAATPWWGRFGGVNDRFAMLKPAAAKAYFETFDRIPKLIECGAPLHPESLVFASLRFDGCRLNDRLKAEFSTRRTEEFVAKQRAKGIDEPLMRPPEITMIDLAHAAMQ